MSHASVLVHVPRIPDVDAGSSARVHARRGGYLPPDENMAANYARRANCRDATVFDAVNQRILIEEAQVAAGHQRLRLHGAGSDATHLHFLTGWSDDRTWMQVR